MSERKINLEDVLTKAFNGKYWDIPFEPCKKAMLEFGKQLLELAAENAEYGTEGYWDEHLRIWVNRKSILDTINQIE